MSVPRRFELWRAAHELAGHLAPMRGNPSAAFVRAGLFHWYELGDPDRRAVLQTVGPMLHDPQFFSRTVRPLWDLTHDFAFLRRNAPHTVSAIAQLRNLAADTSRISDYRELRAEEPALRLETFERSRGTLLPEQLFALLPPRISGADEPLIRAVLLELQRRPLPISQIERRAGALIEYALNHDLGPLEGLDAAIDAKPALGAPLRARLALHLGLLPEATLIETTSATVGAAEWVPYYLDRALLEARRGGAEALVYVNRAAAAGVTDRVLATGLAVAALQHDSAAQREYAGALAQRTRIPPAWRSDCPPDLCNGTSLERWTPGGTLNIRASTVQSDESAPYLEITVDDRLVDEGEVRPSRTFALPLEAGVHRIEIRMVNGRMPNGVHRRVRLS